MGRPSMGGESSGCGLVAQLSHHVVVGVLWLGISLVSASSEADALNAGN